MATQESVRERTEIDIREPKMYQVIMLNDDFTTMEFVVKILVDIFHKEPLLAETLMMDVHKRGRAVVGKYPYDIAVTKVNEALNRAKEEGFPFRLAIEED